MPGATHITNRLEKPELDDRSYRVIKLANQLEALLVHDPDTDKASASANVNVGNFSDDDSMPGMAHAVEHLLFMGTEKYPIENAYNQYLAAHSGSSNAYTGAIETNYFFEVAATGETKTDAANKMDEKNAQSLSSNDTAASSLYSALDRFAQFFIAPLFLESTLDRELRVVDSENKKNLQSDVWRFMQLNKSLSNPKHPYHHFSTGNLQTLRDDPQKRGVEVRSKFIEFHKQAPLHAFPTNSDVPLSSSGVQTVKEAPLKCEPHVRNGDLVNRPSPNELQHQRRRGRGKRRNDAYWKDYNSTDDTDPFDGRECLFSDGRGSLRVPALANLDTALKVPGGLIMSTRYARELGRYQDISHDFDDPCLRSISGHLTPVTGVLRDVVFRLRGTSCTFKRDFFICDAIDDLVDIMLGASFIKDHFKLLFERVWECMSTFSAWFSTKKETKEEKAERERRERDQKIRAHEREILRLQKEQQKEEAAQRRSRAEGAATQS